MNFDDYLSRQKAEDRRAFIIHYPAKSGKTQFVRRVQESRDDVYVLDLQEFFVREPGLAPVRMFGFDALRSLLLSLEVPASVVVVDNPGFLFNTWSADEKRALLSWIRVELRSPADTKKTLVFVVQDDDVLATADFRNGHGEPRVLSLDSFESL